MSGYHLAQINIARMLAPLDHPSMAEFMGRLDEINALAEASPGFVWRLETDEGNATALRPYDDDWIIVNMSVWESPEALMEFTYRSRHNQIMQKRRNWFEPHANSYFVMWWTPAGHVPTVQEAKARLEHLEQKGETAHAFTFRHPFPRPADE